MFNIFASHYGSEYAKLTAQQKAGVKNAIGQCRAAGGSMTTITLDSGDEAYAYGGEESKSGAGICWGVNRAGDGFNVARGICTK